MKPIGDENMFPPVGPLLSPTLLQRPHSSPNGTVPRTTMHFTTFFLFVCVISVAFRLDIPKTRNYTFIVDCKDF